MTSSKFGFIGFLETDEVATLEQAGVDSLWVGGHVASTTPATETMVALSRLAATTDSVTIGSAIVIAPLFAPAILAKQFAEIDRWSGGRVVAGIGVGGDYPEEFEACGVPLNERGPRTDEAMVLLRKLWSGDPVHFAGRFSAMNGVRLRPRPARTNGPPLVVAGRKAPAIRRAALLGDGWMPYLYSPERYRDSVDEIQRMAGEAGRSLDDFGWYAYVNVCVGDDADTARAEAATQLGAAFRGVPGQDFAPMLDRVAVAGTPEMVASKLNGFVEAGARHFIIHVMTADRLAMARRIIDDVVPLVR